MKKNRKRKKERIEPFQNVRIKTLESCVCSRNVESHCQCLNTTFEEPSYFKLYRDILDFLMQAGLVNIAYVRSTSHLIDKQIVLATSDDKLC